MKDVSLTEEADRTFLHSPSDFIQVQLMTKKQRYNWEPAMFSFMFNQYYQPSIVWFN